MRKRLLRIWNDFIRSTVCTYLPTHPPTYLLIVPNSTYTPPIKEQPKGRPGPSEDDVDEDQGYTVLVRMIADRAHSTSAAAVKSLIFLHCSAQCISLSIEECISLSIAECTSLSMQSILLSSLHSVFLSQLQGVFLPPLHTVFMHSVFISPEQNVFLSHCRVYSSHHCRVYFSLQFAVFF